MLCGKNIVLAVTGSIAAYKIAGLASMLKKLDANITVLMTKNATNFINPITFETLTGNKCLVDTFDRNFQYNVEHVALAKQTDVVMIAPASANVIGKIANGIADDMLTTTVMACGCKKIIAPAMNTNMLNSEAYRANAKTLRNRGVFFTEPESGMLACGDKGAGRLASPSKIEEEIISLLFPKCDFAGKTVLVTAGGTIEPLDPVRFIGNRSSGKMGVAIATAAADRGAEVILVCGKVTANASDKRFERIDVVTTKDMYDAVMANVSRADIIIKAAAPCDFRPKIVADAKIKSDRVPVIEFEKTEDIAAAVGKVKGDKKLVVFAAETENTESNAVAKLKKKNADLVVANDVTRSDAGFDVDTNAATLIDSKGSESLPVMTKRELADMILDKICGD